MLDYIDNDFTVFTLWVAMGIEFSGLLHASYVVQILVGLMAGKPIESNEPLCTGFILIFFWARCLFSLTALAFCVAVTMGALFTDRTTIWEGMPPTAAVIIFIILVCIVGMLEGMQIAFFAVAKL
jgi:CHASE2 domain-containing sensor protein